MAVALTNYLITQQAPAHIFEWITGLGVTKRWHFLVARNFLMYAIGAVMICVGGKEVEDVTKIS
jgi:hypothetical protein